VFVPVALTGRLDSLTKAADEAGLPTSRKELVAAIIHAARPTPRKLSATVRRFRGAQVRDAFVPGQSHDAVLRPLRTPGPRQRRLWDGQGLLWEEDPSEPVAQPLDADDALGRVPLRRIGIELPEPLSARLDDLVEEAENAREVTSRQELIAALILTAPTAPNDLGRILREYRTAMIGDTVVPQHDLAPYLEMATPRRGRPSRNQRRGRPGARS
jgi:hypothetical protein